MLRRESRYAAHRRRMNERNHREQHIRDQEGAFDGWTEVTNFDDDADGDEL